MTTLYESSFTFRGITFEVRKANYDSRGNYFLYRQNTYNQQLTLIGVFLNLTRAIEAARASVGLPSEATPSDLIVKPTLSGD